MFPHNTKDREHEKFEATSQNKTAVRVIVKDSGSFLTGLNYNIIEAAYPSPNVEVFSFYLDSQKLSDVFITYTDSSKKNILKVERQDVV